MLIVTVAGGFAEQFLQNDIKVLQSYGATIHLAANFDKPVYAFERTWAKENGIRLHPLPIEKSPLHMGAHIASMRRIHALIKRYRIGLVICHNPMGGADGRIAARLMREYPYVIYEVHGFHFYHGAPIHSKLFYYPAEWLLAGLCDRIITINKEDEQAAKRLPVRHKEKTRTNGVIRLPGVGVDEKRFCPDHQKRRTLREEFYLTDADVHMVSAAELNDNKNIRTVIAAIYLLKKRGVIRSEGEKRFLYTICGHGPKEKSLRRYANALGVLSYVRFAGYVEDMPGVLNSADVFCFPSIREGFGLAAVEALLCGVPLICADNRGTREYAASLENALIVPRMTEETLADAIGRMYEDDGLRQRLAEGSRRSALAFRDHQVERRLYRLYGEILEQ